MRSAYIQLALLALWLIIALAFDVFTIAKFGFSGIRIAYTSIAVSCMIACTILFLYVRRKDRQDSRY